MNRCKRFLMVVLVVSMVCSYIVPAVYAENVVYDVNIEARQDHTQAHLASGTVLSAENDANVLKYVAYSGALWGTQKVTIMPNTSAGSVFFQVPFDRGAEEYDDSYIGNRWVAIEIEGVAAGNYEMNLLSEATGLTSFASFDLYVIPSFDYSKMADSAEIAAYIQMQLNQCKQGASAGYFNASMGGKNPTSERKTVKFETSGDYIIIALAAGPGREDMHKDRCYFGLGQVQLIPSDAQAEITVKPLLNQAYKPINFYLTKAAETISMGQIITEQRVVGDIKYDGKIAYITDSDIFGVTSTVDDLGTYIEVTEEEIWVAIELQGIVKGTYDIDFFNQRFAPSMIKSHGKYDVYIIPGMDYGKLNRKEVQDEIQKQLKNSNKLPDPFDASMSVTDQKDKTSYGTVTFEKDGSYIMVFVCKGVGENNTVKGRKYLAIRNITMTVSEQKADVTVSTKQTKPPVMPTVTTPSVNVEDLSGQVTMDAVVTNAVQSTAFNVNATFQWNGHDYFVGTMRGGLYIIYDLDTKQLIYTGQHDCGTYRGISLDPYGNLWFYGASYYLFNHNLNTNTPGEPVKITQNIGITSFNAFILSWDDVTKKFYFGTYNKGSLMSLDPLTRECKQITGHLDSTPNDGLAADTMYVAWAGVFFKDGYAYFGADGDTNMDGIVSHHIVKYNMKTGKVVDSLDLVAAGVWGTSGHYLGYGKMVGNYILFGSDSMMNKACIVDISGDKMKLVQDTGPLDYGFSGQVSDPINGKCYFFGNTKRQEGLFELDIETMTITELNYVDYPLDMVKLFVQGSSLVTIENDPRLPGTSLITFQYNEYYAYTDLYFYNIETAEQVILPLDMQIDGSGNTLVPIRASDDGVYVYAGAYGNNRVCQYNVLTGETVMYGTYDHQTDGLTLYDGYLYAGNYQTASVTQVNLERNQTKVLFSLQHTMFNQARVHTLTGGDNKIFAGTIPDKAKLGGVLVWYDFEKKLTYVAAGPKPEDVYYANTSIGGADYVWRNVVTNKILLNDLDGDGTTDSIEIDENGKQVQRTHGLIYHQSINCIIYKNGYIIGTTCMAGGSGATPDRETSAVVFVYDVAQMKVVAQLDPRKAFNGYPGFVEQFDCVVADPDIDGKFWAVTAGALISFDVDYETGAIKNAKEEFVIQRSKYGNGTAWHPGNIIFHSGYIYVSLVGNKSSNGGIYMLKKDDPRTGLRVWAEAMHDCEIVLGADNNIYTINDYDIIRLNTYAVAKPYLDEEGAKRAQQLIDALPTDGITLEHEVQIDEARKYYDSLSAEAKANVNAEKLVAAEEALAPLKAAVVDGLIDNIGTVTLDSEAAITAARAAYEELTDLEKTYVTKLSVLVDAEAKLAELKKPVVPNGNKDNSDGGKFPWLIVIVAVAVVAAGAVTAILLLKKKKPLQASEAEAEKTEE